MILREYMRDADESTMYHIGCLSGFWFIGTKKEFFEQIGGLSDKRYKAISKMVRRDEKAIYNLEHSHSDLTIYPFLLGEKKRMQALVEERRQYLHDFVPYSEREVAKEYNRDIEKDGRIIIVEGCEIGKYWWRKDVERGMSSKSEEI